jgi:hypothetical protein
LTVIDWPNFEVICTDINVWQQGRGSSDTHFITYSSWSFYLLSTKLFVHDHKMFTLREGYNLYSSEAPPMINNFCCQGTQFHMLFCQSQNMAGNHVIKYLHILNQ